jgi:DNA-binding NarL/FixJ family response regulator
MSARRIIVGGSTIYSGLERAAASKRELVVVRCSDALVDILDYTTRLSPCVVIMDEFSLHSGGGATITDLREFGTSIKALVRASAAEDPDIVTSFLRLGCSGVLRSDDVPATVLKAVRAVASDELWVGRTVLSRIVRTLLFADKYSLTPRENEILTLIGDGYKNQVIADRLFISPQTVRWHIRGLYTKIGVHDRKAAVVYARSHCWARTAGG